MAILDMFDKIDDIVYKPIETICEWTKEPLKYFQNKRDEKAKDQEIEREIDKKTAEADIEAEKERKQAILNADIRKWDEKLNDLICSNEIKRNKKRLDMITEYRRSMIEDAQNIADNLSRMEMALVEDAHNLVLAITEKYKLLQNKAMSQCDQQLKFIEEAYANNERVKIRREDHVLNQVDDIIKVSQMFIEQLNIDIKSINEGNKVRVDESTKRIDEIMRKFNVAPAIDTPNQPLLK